MWLVVTRLHYLHKFRCHGLQCQRIGHGSLLKITSTRAAFARPGPGVTPFPDVLARMQPSDSLPPSATAPAPLARGLPRCRRLFCAPRRADDTCARTRVVRRRRVTGAPRHRDWSRRGEGLPGDGTVLFICAMVEHPAGDTPSSPGRHLCKGVLLPSGKPGPSASGKTLSFGAACPMAHMFARRRIADPISGIVARLTTGAGGLTLGRTGFAPTGRQTKFPEGIASSFPFDPHCLVALVSLACLSLDISIP